jgi:hypothetical protein
MEAGLSRVTKTENCAATSLSCKLAQSSTDAEREARPPREAHDLLLLDEEQQALNTANAYPKRDQQQANELNSHDDPSKPSTT